MTKFKTTLLTGAVCIFGMTFSACAKDDTSIDTISNTETVESIETSARTDTLDAKVIPASAPAEEPQDMTGHEGHGHAAPAPIPEGLEHVYDFAADEFLWGQADAPVDMIVYASVVCGHCGQWFTNQWPELKSKYVDTGKVRVAFREIITEPQQIAVPGFIVAACAPDDKHMDIIVHQMQTQEKTFAAVQDGTISDIFNEWANMAGLDTDAKIEACFAEPSHGDRLNLSGTRASAAGIQGVPGIIINGNVHHSQDKSAETLSKKIDALLE